MSDAGLTALDAKKPKFARASVDSLIDIGRESKAETIRSISARILEISSAAEEKIIS